MMAYLGNSYVIFDIENVIFDIENVKLNVS